jgi:tRNA dimethylallyltransferase
MAQPANRPLAVAIMGPTASGKTAAALAIAERIPSEIISVDSALVYRGMDIGTAKPTPRRTGGRAAPPDRHHRPTGRLFGGAVPQRCAAPGRRDRARGKLPLLVGGTMLYFKGLADGLDDLPGADPPCARSWKKRPRTRLARHACAPGPLDPVTAARLAPADAQRIQRALEICTLSGKPMSALLAQREQTELPFELSFALEPSDRAVLHERIARRFDLMLPIARTAIC